MWIVLRSSIWVNEVYLAVGFTSLYKLGFAAVPLLMYFTTFDKVIAATETSL